MVLNFIILLFLATCAFHLTVELQCYHSELQVGNSKLEQGSSLYYTVGWSNESIETCEEDQLCIIRYDDRFRKSHPYESLVDAGNWPKGERGCMAEEDISSLHSNEEIVENAACFSFTDIEPQTICSCSTNLCNDEVVANATMEFHSKVSFDTISRRTTANQVRCPIQELNYDNFLSNTILKNNKSCLGQWCLLEVFNRTDVQLEQFPHKVDLTCTAGFGCQNMDNECRIFGPSMSRLERTLLTPKWAIPSPPPDGAGVVQCCCKDTENCTLDLIPKAAALYKKKISFDYRHKVINCSMLKTSRPEEKESNFWTKLKNCFVTNEPPETNETCAGNWCVLKLKRHQENKITEQWTCAFNNYSGNSVCDKSKNGCFADERNNAICCCDSNELCTTSIWYNARVSVGLEFETWAKYLVYFIIVALGLFAIFLIAALINCILCQKQQQI